MNAQVVSGARLCPVFFCYYAHKIDNRNLSVTHKIIVRPYCGNFNINAVVTKRQQAGAIAIGSGAWYVFIISVLVPFLHPPLQ